MEELSRRLAHAAESILDNESLTTGLDDAASQVLLQWAIERAKMIAQHTFGLSDDQAERVMSARLRAIRRLMGLANQWVAQARQMDDESRTGLLDDMIEQAAIIHRGDSRSPARSLLDDAETREEVSQFPEASADVHTLIGNLEASAVSGMEGADGPASQG